MLDGFLEGAGREVTITGEASTLAGAWRMSAYDALVSKLRREDLRATGHRRSGLLVAEKYGRESCSKLGKGFTETKWVAAGRTVRLISTKGTEAGWSPVPDMTLFSDRCRRWPATLLTSGLSGRTT